LCCCFVVLCCWCLLQFREKFWSRLPFGSFSTCRSEHSTLAHTCTLLTLTPLTLTPSHSPPHTHHLTCTHTCTLLTLTPSHMHSTHTPSHLPPHTHSLTHALYSLTPSHMHSTHSSPHTHPLTHLSHMHSHSPPHTYPLTLTPSHSQTLDLLFKMTNPLNVAVISDRLIGYLHQTRDEYVRSDLVTKITQLAERFAPDNQWFLQTMTAVFEQG